MPNETPGFYWHPLPTAMAGYVIPSPKTWLGISPVHAKWLGPVLTPLPDDLQMLGQWVRRFNDEMEAFFTRFRAIETPSQSDQADLYRWAMMRDKVDSTIEVFGWSRRDWFLAAHEAEHVGCPWNGESLLAEPNPGGKYN